MLAALLCVAAPAWAAAKGLECGGHAAYVVGGSLAGDTLGYGLQVASRINEVLSLELAGTRFVDDNGPLDLESSVAALSVRLGAHPAEGIGVYVSGGANYNLLDVVPPDGARTRIAPAFGYHYGAGITLTVLDRLDLFAQYRGSSVAFEDPFSGDLAAQFDETYTYDLVMVGASFAL
jgi:opacity protein-like surface antigen